MKKIIRYLTLLFLIIFTNTLKNQAQNLSFNQYNLAPLSVNPGQSGVLKDTWISLNYRSSSLQTGDNFNTVQASGFLPLQLGKHRLVFSGSFYSNRLSEFFSINGGTLGAALSLKISERSELSFGSQLALSGTSSVENFTTDSQFVNGLFDPSLPSGEFINPNPGSILSISSGLYWQQKDRYDNVKVFAGLSLFNFTQPDVSISEQGNENHPITYKATAGYQIYKKDRFAVLPNILGISRNGQQHIQAGSFFSYDLIDKNISDSNYEVKQLGIGTWYTTNESIIFALQYNQPNLKAALSFDLPTGNSFESIRNNTIEIAVQYKLFKKKRKDNLTEKNKPSIIIKETEFSKITEVEKKETLATKPVIIQKEAEKEIPENVNSTLVRPTSEEETILDESVRFKLESDILNESSQNYLNEVIRIFKKYENLHIRLIGHTCSLGTQELNKGLSLQRAENVKTYLLLNGIDSKRITTEGKGETQPLAENTSEETRQLNRRVEIKIQNGND